MNESSGVPSRLAPLSIPRFGFGVQLTLVLGMVTGIHFVEAYLLNPAIYAAHLKLHPLLVLSVLVVAEHSLGVWGLLLAGTTLTLSIKLRHSLH